MPKYYRYADPNYSIFDMPLSENDYEIMKEAVEMLKQLEDFDHFSEMADMYEQHGQFDEDNNESPLKNRTLF